jgi:hypothetical protein
MARVSDETRDPKFDFAPVIASSFVLSEALLLNLEIMFSKL